VPPSCRLLAPAKLTRSLRIVGVRGDGYHLLDAEMATLELADVLELEEGGDGFEVVDEIAYVGQGEPAPDPVGAGWGEVPAGAANLVLKALELVGRRARVRLIKHIPPGAGLGGGSSDGAAVLRWAGADPALGVRLGADVPFCAVGGRARVGGIGEQVEPLEFEEFTAVLVTPALVVSTPEVYRVWDALGGPTGEHGNDLEPAALALEPRLSWWRDLVASVTGEVPRLAGSGGTWYLERDRSSAGQLVDELRGAVATGGGRALVVAASSAPESTGAPK
jgi:4-diphosphocytidyl-2-C-methyl-D-erythritol kinase